VKVKDLSTACYRSASNLLIQGATTKTMSFTLLALLPGGKCFDQIFLFPKASEDQLIDFGFLLFCFFST